MTWFVQDLRYAVRTLARRPGFTFVVVATLALGIGANTAIFSVADTVLLREPPFPESDRLVLLWQRSPSMGYAQLPVSYPNFADVAARAQGFGGIAAWNSSPGTTLPLLGRGEPEQVRYAGISPALFDVLGVAPVLGRGFRAQEDREGERVVVLSHAFWRRVFAADPAAIGTQLRLGDASWTVVGVLPKDFRFVTYPAEPQLFVPLRADPSLPGGNRSPLWARGAAFLGVVARLRDGVALEQAVTGVRELGRRIADENPGSNRHREFSLVPLREQAVGGIRPTLLLLLGAVGLVLLIACANVANLLLTRAVGREREIAVRCSLGASRRRVLAQMATESLVLAGSGGVLGVVLAVWAIDALALQSFGAPDPFVPFSVDPSSVQVNARVLAFTVVVTLLTGVLFGLAPALQTVRSDSFGALRDGGRAGSSRQGSRARDALVVAEVAVAVLLLIGAGLLVSSLVRLHRVDAGFDAESVVALELDLPDSKYGAPERAITFYDAVLSRARAFPGVTAAGALERLPLSGPQQSTDFRLAGEPAPEPGSRPNLEYASVTTAALPALRVPLRAGRFFDDTDGARAQPIAIINQSAAQRLFPGRDAVGQRIALSVEALRFRADGPPTLDFESAYRTVVGVVGDVKHDGLGQDARPGLYIPYAQRPQSDMNIVVRAVAEPGAIADALRDAVHEIDPDQPVGRMTTLDAIVARSLGTPRFRTILLGLFAAVAAALAAIGLYGLLAFTVSQRTHELGVRIAFGASPREIFTLVTSRALRLAAIGLALGTTAAALLTRLLDTLLFEVEPLDPLTFTTAPLLLLIVAIIAAAPPARRAARADPLTSLRAE